MKQTPSLMGGGSNEPTKGSRLSCIIVGNGDGDLLLTIFCAKMSFVSKSLNKLTKHINDLDILKSEYLLSWQYSWRQLPIHYRLA